MLFPITVANSPPRRFDTSFPASCALPSTERFLPPLASPCPHHRDTEQCNWFQANKHQFIRDTTLARARNIALKNATGEWVVILDSDDWLASNLGEMLVALPAHLGLVAFETEYFDDVVYEYRRIRHFEHLFNLYGGTIFDPFLWFDFYYHGIIARRTCSIGSVDIAMS